MTTFNIPQAVITKAVFPVAGLGTRFLPATKAQPKEMLPVVDKPLIQYAVEEAYAAGIRHMIFVTGRNKRAIEDHFDTAYELEAELEASQKDELLRLVRSIQIDDMDCSYVRQSRSLGLGHAVLCAERIVGNEPFAVLLADDLMINPATPPVSPTTPASQPPIASLPVLAQMVQMFEELGTSILAVQEVPLALVSRYGIVAGERVQDRLMRVRQIVEKPKPENAPSTMAVAGRYILTPEIFNHIRQQATGANGEIQLTDGIASLLHSQSVHAYQYFGTRYDCGSKAGFLEATVELALQHPEVGDAFRQFLKGLKL
ncbi:MAG: UTP--glucose-1-phosphate uridylyltransferase GalU [Burkholderiaceae bacterium]|nr:UTP--glucose-1-phosphate uridylyltransferase GalU [Burkholderiaceae bacterium]